MKRRRPGRTDSSTETTCGCLRSAAKTGSISLRTAGSCTLPSPRTANTRLPVSPLRENCFSSTSNVALRFGTGQRERLEQIASDGLPQHADADECDDPGDDDDAPSPIAELSELSEHGVEAMPNPRRVGARTGRSHRCGAGIPVSG